MKPHPMMVLNRVVICLLLVVSVAQSQVPQITSISAQTLTRSGRLRIFGTNFGSGGSGSQVLIDGQSAIVTRWNPSRINAYVPELAGPGSVTVQVVTPVLHAPRAGAAGRCG